MEQHLLWAEESGRRWRDLYDLADRFFVEVKAFVAEGGLQQHDVLQIVRELLFGRVLSGTKALVLLAQHGLLVEAESQFRSNMEALFRLAALVEDASMLPLYLGEDYPRRKRAMEDVRSLLAGMVDRSGSAPSEEQIDEAIRRIDSEAEDFRKTNGLDRLREIRTWDWVEKGNQHDFFYGKYLLHSGVTHHAARDLSRRLLLSEDRAEIRAILFRPDTDSPEQLIYDALLLLARAMELRSRAAALELSDNAWALKQELDALSGAAVH